MSPNVIKLFSKSLEFFTSATRRSMPTCHKMRSFVCKNFHPNWNDSESFSSSVTGIYEMSLWTSNMTGPPWIFLTFLYTLYGHVSGKSSEVAIELSILVSWIATTYGWWKSKKASNSSFLPLMRLMFMLMNFNPLKSLWLRWANKKHRLHYNKQL